MSRLMNKINQSIYLSTFKKRVNVSLLRQGDVKHVHCKEGRMFGKYEDKHTGRTYPVTRDWRGLIWELDMEKVENENAA